jgi:hypothetical protein
MKCFYLSVGLCALVALSARAELPTTFLKGTVGQRVGGGECAHMVSEALRVGGFEFFSPDVLGYRHLKLRRLPGGELSSRFALPPPEAYVSTSTPWRYLPERATAASPRRSQPGKRSGTGRPREEPTPNPIQRQTARPAMERTECFTVTSPSAIHSDHRGRAL